MPDIRLPDGSIGRFPDEMSDAEIAAVLEKQFPAPIPQAQNPLPPKRMPRRIEATEWAPDVVRPDERPFPSRRPPRVLLSPPGR